MPELSPQAQKILARVLALRQWTRETGMRTTKTQNDLLTSLSNLDFSEVVFQIHEMEKDPNRNEKQKTHHQ